MATPVVNGDSSHDAGVVKLDDWRHLGMLSPVTTPWGYSLPAGSLQKLLTGFKPSDMDDRWFIAADGPPNDRGAVVVHFIRSWTGFTIVDAYIEVPLDNEGRPWVELAAKITEIRWESAEERYRGEGAEAVKDLVLRLMRHVLQIEV